MATLEKEETPKALMRRLGLELAEECSKKPDTPKNLVGVDATMPYHRTMNPTPAEHLAWWVKEKRYEEQRPFYLHFQDILDGLRGGHYRTRKEIATAYGKAPEWVSKLLKVAVGQGIMPEAEMRSYFKRTSQYDPHLTAQRGPSSQLCRAQFESVFLAHGLSFDLVMGLLRAGAWARVHELASDFHQGGSFTTALRTFLVREGTMTAEQWGNCFRPVEWLRLAEKYRQGRDS